ncbi:MAG TPA: PHP domain-containing protein [Firmicutes bacterium]|nr:PHP domain-containing protein [Bacillota bacterium]
MPGGLGYLRADLHIHTALSPCAESEMTPAAIMEEARRKGVGLVGITDHNSAENAVACLRAGARSGVHVLPGMEVQTREEIHVLTFFGSIEPLMDWQQEVYAHLPAERNREEFFGEQLILDEEGGITGKCSRLLLTSTDLSLAEVVRRTQELGGLVIPAHIDRPSYSLIRNLGFVPPGLHVNALELSPHISRDEAYTRFPWTRAFPLITSSDAHRLREIHGRTVLCIGDDLGGAISRATGGDIDGAGLAALFGEFILCLASRAGRFVDTLWWEPMNHLNQSI